MAQLRLDKYLADMGVGSRADVKKMIKKNRVCVDGVVIKAPEKKVDTQTTEVTVDGKLVTYAEVEYYMLHKPQGVVSATTDNKHQTVVDLITDKKRKDLFPVGRLDIDTEGLLLLTNDGMLAHELLTPLKHVDKEYEVIVYGVLDECAVNIFQTGLDIGTDEEPEITQPAQLLIQQELSAKALMQSQTHQYDIVKNNLKQRFDRMQEQENQETLNNLAESINENSFEANIEQLNVSVVRVVLHEGKYHQIKRMFEKLGHPVLYLKRVRMGLLQLDESLKLGQYRALTKEEVEQLKQR